VHAANRYNFSLDQRLSIRGFGSRAPFGTRGLKILLDGIPQTTPDGQSQFTNLELGTIGRVEVLRGSASSLYGNAAGGAILLTSDGPPGAGAAAAARLEAGSFGLLKWQARGGFRAGRWAGTASAARTTWEGFRQQSEADIRQLNTSLRFQAGPRTSLTLRVNAGLAPRARNPGALTAAEYAANRDSAAANNILRGADKDSRQVQGGLTLRHADGSGNETEATAFGYARDIDNPTATPSSPATPDGGTWIQLNRDVAGIRLSHSRRLRPAPASPRMVAGVDLQRMSDDRRNWRSEAGRRTTTLLVDQQEEVEQAGPFAQLAWTPSGRLSVAAGARFDWFRFTATDRYLADGEDNSGRRTMSAWSASAGASWVAGPLLVPYLHLATSFETPTTAELSIRPGDEGGFSADLEPQRAVNAELGARGESGRFDWSLAVFRVGIENAIVQWREIGGRSYFQNAGAITNWGAEVGAGWSPAAGTVLRVAYTWSRYRFDDYRVQQGTDVTVFDGKTLPGLPEHWARVSLALRPVAAVDLDLEQALSSAVWTDDPNTPERRVPSWGAGVTSARAAWRTPLSRWGLTPFGGINNLFNRRYVGSVVVNGAFGRVLEPAPGRNAYVGAEVRWGTSR